VDFAVFYSVYVKNIVPIRGTLKSFIIALSTLESDLSAVRDSYEMAINSGIQKVLNLLSFFLNTH
jgi:hypothetical protein